MRFTIAVALSLTLWTLASMSAPAQAALSLTDHCNLNVRYLLAREKVSFPPSSAELRPGAAAIVDSIAEIAAFCPDAAIVIEGHTDNRGGESYNSALSQARAQSVADALIARGIAPSRPRVTGMGSLRPIADNATRDGRAINRRIGIRFIKPAD